MINPLDMSYVYKRERYLEKRKNINENTMLFEDTNTISKNSNMYKIRVEGYLNSNPSINGVINLLENLYSENNYTLLEEATSAVASEIIPTISNNNIHHLIASLESANIGDINKDRLIETAKMYKSIDRIIKNHKSLNEKFSNYDNIFSNRAKSVKERCYSICEFVDTYTISPFIKMNIALEELCYRNYMENSDITEKAIVENVSTYFLLRDNNTKQDIQDYIRCIKESKVLNENDIKYTWFDRKKNSSIYNWIISENKSEESLKNLIIENMNSLSNLETVVELCNDFADINSLDCDSNKIFKSINEVSNIESANNMLHIIKESNTDAEDLIGYLEMIKEADINDMAYNDFDQNQNTFTSSEIDKFKMNNLISDAKDAGDFLDQMEKSSMKESPLKFKKIKSFDDVELNENNIIDYVDNHDHISLVLRGYNYSGTLDQIHEFAESVRKCINNTLYNSDSVCYYTISEGYIDFSIRSKYFVNLSLTEMKNRSFAVSDKDTILEIMSYSAIANELNESSIYKLMERLNDPYYAANVSAKEVSTIAEFMNPYITEDNNFINEFMELCKEEANPDYDYMKYLVSCIYEGELDIDNYVKNINECYEYLEEAYKTNLQKKLVGNLKKSVNDIKNISPFNKNKKDDEKEELEKPNKMEVSPEKINKPVVNKTKVAGNINPDDEEEDDEKESNDDKSVKNDTPDNNEDSENKTNKKPNYEEEGGKINLNDVKLAWKAARNKMGKLDAKQAEICKDIDMTFNRMTNSIDSVTGSAAKTDAITGKVSVSFTQLIKLSIALIAAGGASGAIFNINPLIVPIGTAITLFAKSHYISKKEKQMVLDQIDVELKVLDRELSRAEASGSPKKYRQLLTIQKNLQRRRQQIHFQLARKGKKIPLPSSSGQDTKED